MNVKNIIGTAFITSTIINSGVYDIFASLSKYKYIIIHTKINTDDMSNTGFFMYLFNSNFNIIAPNLHNKGMYAINTYIPCISYYLLARVAFARQSFF